MAELLVDAKPAPGDSNDGSGQSITKIVGPIALAAAVAKMVSPLAGLGALVAAVGIVLALRAPSEGRTILRVDDGQLEIRREKRKDVVARFPITELENVTLDREARSAGGRASERVRLALMRTDHDPVFVPEERITTIEGQEWQAKVRVFLRANGWLPIDERS
jgi:hypothetical protein